MSDTSVSNHAHRNELRDFVFVIAFILVTTLMVWAPFLFRLGSDKSVQNTYGFEAVYRNYDGPLFVIPAKTLYRSDQIEKLRVLDLKPAYYAAHMPGYVFLIRLCAPLFGYLTSMLYVNVLASIIFGCLLILLYKDVFKARRYIELTMMTLLLPRLWVIRSVGSSEMVFMTCILASILLFSNKRYVWSALFAFFASFTRIHGVLWGASLVGYFIYLSIKSERRDIRVLIPALGSVFGFVAVCLVYLRQYGDFFAYFHTTAVVPIGMVYSQFDSKAKEIKTFFLEDILFYFGILWIYIFDQWKKNRDVIFVFVIIYFGFVLTIQHRDIARYLLPVMPFVIGTAHKLFEKASVRYALVALVPAVYWYVVNFMSSNIFLDSMKSFM